MPTAGLININFKFQGDGQRKVWLEGGDAMVGDGEGEVLWREALERWNGWEGLYGEVAFERGSAVVGGCGRCRCFGKKTQIHPLIYYHKSNAP